MSRCKDSMSPVRPFRDFDVLTPTSKLLLVLQGRRNLKARA
jgi:hypothetical protein